MYYWETDEIIDAIYDSLENVDIAFKRIVTDNNSMWYDGQYYYVELDLDKGHPFSGPRSAERALQEELDFNFRKIGQRAIASYVGEEEIQIYIEQR